MSAQQVFLIRTDLTRHGDGSPDNPWRIVTEYWTPEGALVAQIDPEVVEQRCDRCLTWNSRDGTPETCRKCVRVERDASRATSSELHTLQLQLRREVSTKSEQLATLKLTLESQQKERAANRDEVARLRERVAELNIAESLLDARDRRLYQRKVRKLRREREKAQTESKIKVVSAARPN